jgi:AraC-like DNA-binding protein
MDRPVPHPADGPPGATLSRAELSIGALDLLRLVDYDHAFPRHAHDHYTVGVFAAGNGSLRYRHAKWLAADGAVLAVPPDEVHAAEPLPGHGWTYRTLYPTTALVALALDDPSRSEPAFFARPIFDDPQLARRVLEVHRALCSPVRDLGVEVALLDVLRTLLVRHAAARPSRVPRRARAVAHAREYLDAHFAQPVKLAQLAAACESSPFHLVRSFRDAVGMPPHAYLTQVRANRARDLLVRGESLSAVAYACGFCDQSHLTHTFKRIFGVTPGAYTGALRVRARGA